MKKKYDASQVTNELENSSFFKQADDTKIDTKDDTHNDTYQSTSNDTHVSLHQLPSPDAVDEMLFRYRKLPKVRTNADVPVEWKDELDEYAHKHKLGKYHLVMYAVAKMLGKL